MAIHLQARLSAGRNGTSTLWLLLVAGALATPPAQAQTNTFVENPELNAISDLLNQGHLEQAKQRATEIINRPSRAFASAKRERHIKASALYSRSFAERRLGMDAAAASDARRAASMGHATAAIYCASLLNAAAEKETDPGKRSDLQAQIESHLRMAAELGDPMGIADLERILRESGRPERHYWQLLNFLGQKEPGKLSEFLRFYREDLSDADRGLLVKAMREQSVSGGEAHPADKRMPGRSTLTAAVVDLEMRSMLEVSWRSSFDPKPDPSDETVEASLQRHAQARHRYPFLEMYFVTRPPIQTKYRATLALSYAQGPRRECSAGRFDHCAMRHPRTRGDRLGVAPGHGAPSSAGPVCGVLGTQEQ